MYRGEWPSGLGGSSILSGRIWAIRMYSERSKSDTSLRILDSTKPVLQPKVSSRIENCSLPSLIGVMIVSSCREDDKVFILHEKVGLCEEGRPALLALGRLRLVFHNFFRQLKGFFEFLSKYFGQIYRNFGNENHFSSHFRSSK